MKVTDRLKQLIFKQLYRELGNAEIIQYKDSIWFINREEKYWYFEFEKAGTLYWRYSFFPSFFTIFSLERDDFEPILTSWVEEVLNHKVSTTNRVQSVKVLWVEGVLNHKVSTTTGTATYQWFRVEEVLNHKVSTTKPFCCTTTTKVEGVLNHKVTRTEAAQGLHQFWAEGVLNHKVSTTESNENFVGVMVEEVLNNTQQNESNR